jgi:hypothetical protein
MLKHIICVVVSLFFANITNAESLPISTRTKTSCISDYYRFCQHWPHDELRKCFQMNVLRVSVTCTEALIDEGLISKVEVDTMKRQTIAMMNAKPLVKSISSPPINPNPTIEEIKNPSTIKKVNDKKSLKKPTKNTKTTKPIDATFERWKKQNGF